MNLKQLIYPALIMCGLLGLIGCGGSSNEHAEEDGHDHGSETAGHEEHGSENEGLPWGIKNC